MSDEEHEEHAHEDHPNFARGEEKEEHDEHHDESRPDFARGERAGEVTTDSERGTFGDEHVHDERQGDFARGQEDEVEDEDEGSDG